MEFNFTSSPRVIFGKDALKSAVPYMTSFGKKALIVTGKNITKTGLVSSVQKILADRGICSAVFNNLTGEPDDIMINEGLEVFKKENCSFLIGLGGGTPLDTAKAIAALTVLPGKLADYAGKEIKGNFPPLVLIPTTAGTGSEATKYLVFTDTATQEKLLLKSDDFLPKIAVIDFTYTVSTPPSVTLATGMDALTHAIESFTCRKASPATDIYCLDAVKRIFENLPLAIEDGTNLKAREQLSFASWEAGVAINGSPTTIVHGMSRPIGAVFHVSHGISNAMLLTECLREVCDGCPERFFALALQINAAEKTDDPKTGTAKFLAALENFTQKLKVPTLKEYGIDLEKFKEAEEKMAKASTASGSPGNCWKVLTAEEQIALYEKLRLK